MTLQYLLLMILVNTPMNDIVNLNLYKANNNEFLKTISVNPGTYPENIIDYRYQIINRFSKESDTEWTLYLDDPINYCCGTLYSKE